MNEQLVVADISVDYAIHEAGVIIVALAWVIAIGGLALATIIICGWRGAKSVAFDWLHMKATFFCR